MKEPPEAREHDDVPVQIQLLISIILAVQFNFELKFTLENAYKFYSVNYIELSFEMTPWLTSDFSRVS